MNHLKETLKENLPILYTLLIFVIGGAIVVLLADKVAGWTLLFTFPVFVWVFASSIEALSKYLKEIGKDG